MKKINKSTGAINTVAEQDSSNLTQSIFNCNYINNNYNNTGSVFGTGVWNNSKLYFTCRTSNKVYLIETDFTAQTMVNYELISNGTGNGYLFSYKNEIYATTASGTLSQISLSGGNLTTSASNQLNTDLISACTSLYPNSDCASQTPVFQVASAMIGNLQGSSNEVFNFQPLFVMAATTEATTPKYMIIGFDNSGIITTNSLRMDSPAHTLEDQFNGFMPIYTSILNVPGFIR